MRRAVLPFVVLLLCGAVRAADGPPSPPPGPADVEFFEKKVRPLLAERCYSCHSVQSKKQRGGLLLDSRAAVLKGGDNGPAVVPGEPERSRLVEAVRYRTTGFQMPPTGKLPDRDIDVLEEWVRRGVPFPGPDATASAKKIDFDKGRQHWAFQPLRAVTLPEARDRSWAERDLDVFILAELQRHGLSQSPAASPRTLIRRVTFDLTGLPPTPEEVEEFEKLSGAKPQAAYEALVDRLLASPLYGERWGRFWLDLARYCDVAEPWTDQKGQPWLYRDWVVQALNDDLPYDQFVLKQLAADQLPDARPEDRAALGFLGLSPSYWKELKLDKDVIKTVVAEEWEEHVQAVSGTFLGLTAACARCHDHKFDPISQQDYYALAGVFASTRPAARPLIPDDVAAPAMQARERAAAAQAEIEKLQAKKPILPETQKQIDDLKAEIERLKKTPHFDDPLAPAVEDASLLVLADGPHRTKLEYRPGEAQDVALQVRGNPANLGPVVPRRFLTVLSPGTPPPFRQGSGRLDLARAIVTDAAPLTARVIVNRVWKHHFGSGLVETPSDFGSQGARPTHPELLDHLAERFVAHGWSLKWLHREILLSEMYRQSSGPDERKQAIDPDNRWLWRMNRRRLEVEAWRDAMLAASGTLSLQRGGPSLDLGDPRNNRRTVYGTVKRRELSDLLRLHDFPDPTMHSPGRIPTTTPLQQLFTLNSPFVQQQSAALARRLAAEAPDGLDRRVQRACWLLYGRPAKESEITLAREFLTAAEPPILWQEYAQVLLGSNEFLFID